MAVEKEERLGVPFPQVYRNNLNGQQKEINSGLSSFECKHICAANGVLNRKEKTSWSSSLRCIMASELSRYIMVHSAKRSSKVVAVDSDLSDEDEEVFEFDQAKFERAKQKGKKRSRMGISEEVFGSFNKRESTEFRNIPKSE